MFLRVLIVALTMFWAGSTPLHAQWRRAISDNFIVYSQGPEKSLREFTVKLERFDNLLHFVTGREKKPVEGPKLSVYLVYNVEAVQRLHSGKRNVGGFYVARPGGAIAVVPRQLGGSGSVFDTDTEMVLYHEYAHHFMLAYFAVAYPAWYIEGFADFYSTAEPGGDGIATAGKPVTNRFLILYGDKPMPLAQLFDTRTAQLDNRDMGRFYARAWLLTHYLTFNKARSGQLDRYIQAINKSVDPQQAALDAFGPFDVLSKELERYQVARKISYLQIQGQSTAVPSVTVEMLDPAESAFTLLRLAYQLGISEDEAEKFQADVRTLAARHPGTAAAHDMLADAALLREDLAAAEAANDACLALKPADTRALLRRATIATKKLEAADKAEAKDWKAIRTLIAKANRSNPNDPQPLIAYYQSFHREGVWPPVLAVDGLTRAVQLSPHDREARFLLATQWLNEDRIDDAEMLLRPAANDPHDPQARENIRQMIEAARKRKAEASAATAPQKETGD